MKDWFERRKTFIIFMGVLFIILSLFLVPAFARVGYENTLETSEYFEKGFLVIFPELVKDVFGNLKIAFGEGFQNYLEVFKVYGILYFLATIALLLKMSGNKDYNKIEHGSADWCDNKEKYSVLSPKDGMILAQKTCLPVIPKPPEGKNGNILVIRRFWCW